MQDRPQFSEQFDDCGFAIWKASMEGRCVQVQRVLLTILCVYLLANATSSPNRTAGSSFPPTVRVYHFAINYWAESYSGEMSCGREIRCIWSHSDHIKTLRHRMNEDLEADRIAIAASSTLSSPDSNSTSKLRRALLGGAHGGGGGSGGHHFGHAARIGGSGSFRGFHNRNESINYDLSSIRDGTAINNSASGRNSSKIEGFRVGNNRHHHTRSGNHPNFRLHASSVSTSSSSSSSSSITSSTITLSVYNVHSWWERTREHHPASCELRTNLTLVETEESRARFSKMFDPIFKNFDGFSSTHPTAHVQRVYIDAFLNESNFINKTLNPFPTLIKGGSYVASDCHKRDSANSNRDNVVGELRKYGVRVDGLGQCMHTPTGPEGVALPTGKEFRYSLSLKRIAISKFLFNMAFENSIEPGYVTEKPFDALVSGTVPVYLGDSTHLKSLLPHPKAAIFVSDYTNIESLAKYLLYLSKNETAYEEHREWRKSYSQTRHLQNSSPLLKSPWYCRVCEWALETSKLPHKPRRFCVGDGEKRGENTLHDYEGRIVRGQRGKELFFVQNGTLHSVPNMDTFLSLKIDISSVVAVPDADIKQMPMGLPLKKVE